MKVYKFMKYNNRTLVFLILSTLFLYSCQSDYTKLVERELATGIKNDTLMYNLKFGDTRKEFYEICWDLNSKGLVTHGGNNNYVKRVLRSKDSTLKTKAIKMLFYAQFSNRDIITGMNLKFTYSAWAPWNKTLQADNLFPVVQDTILKWYPGNPFIEVKKGLLVKIDGNRQIQISKESEKDVAVLIENLAYKYNALVN